MGSISDFLENELVDHLLQTAYTPAATLYLALATADPTDAATGASMNEVADSGSYARTAITFGAASARAVTQNADVTFPVATGSWGTVTHFAIVDSATHGAGNVLGSGALTSSRTISSTDELTIPSGEVVVSWNAGGIANYAANASLDLAFRNQAFAVSANYLALATASIADTDTGTTITEVSEGGYSREQVNAAGGASPAWNAASGGVADNAHDVVFGPATANWTAATRLALTDAATAGNLLAYTTITGVTALDGDSIKFSAGNITVTAT